MDKEILPSDKMKKVAFRLDDDKKNQKSSAKHQSMLLRKGDGLRQCTKPRDKVEILNKSTVDQGSDPIVLSEEIKEEEDSFVSETKEQIRLLEERIERLDSLKKAIVSRMNNADKSSKFYPIDNEHFTKQIQLADGSTYCCYMNGIQKRCYPNGDIEIRTNTYVKRKFACGKVKIVYSNGLQEILYNDGRLLFKNSLGHVIND